MADPSHELLKKDRIIDTINQLFIATDQRDWAAEMTSQQIVERWEQGLRPVEQVHHQVGNYRIRIQDGQATAFCYGIASH
jgi:hypothetical protein